MYFVFFSFVTMFYLKGVCLKGIFLKVTIGSRVPQNITSTMQEKDSVSKEEVDEVPLDEEVKVKEQGSAKDTAQDTASSQPAVAVIEESVEQELTIVPGEKEKSEAVDTKAKDDAGEETAKKDDEAAAAEADVGSDEERPPLPVRKSTNEVPTKKDTNPILAQLKEAFPGIEDKYVKAVLIASQGALDPAFNALLFLSDPSFEAEAPLPATAPVATAEPRRALTQVEQDELLARKLDEQFNHDRHRRRNMDSERAARERRIQNRQREYERRNAQRDAPPPGNDRYYDDYNDDDDFLSQLVDKDLPELREKVGRQVQETSKRVNDWISGFRKSWAQEPQPEDEPIRPAGRTARFNSFGAQVGEDPTEPASRLSSHGISLRDADRSDDDEDIPPQLPSRNREKEVVPETTYIDTPDVSTRKKWQPLSPEPLNASPSKTPSKPSSKPDDKAAEPVAAAVTPKKKPDEDEFLINSDDEM